MMNAKRRKRAEARNAILAELQARFDLENVEQMDALADALGIIRLSDYLKEKQAEARAAGLCTCPHPASI